MCYLRSELFKWIWWRIASKLGRLKWRWIVVVKKSFQCHTKSSWNKFDIKQLIILGIAILKGKKIIKTKICTIRLQQLVYSRILDSWLSCDQWVEVGNIKFVTKSKWWNGLRNFLKSFVAGFGIDVIDVNVINSAYTSIVRTTKTVNIQ